jgi:hypothetical protein
MVERVKPTDDSLRGEVPVETKGLSRKTAARLIAGYKYPVFFRTTRFGVRRTVF